MNLFVLALGLAAANTICAVVFIKMAKKAPVMEEIPNRGRRSIHELLIILKQDVVYDKHFLYMCHNIKALHDMGLISVNETSKLQSYLLCNPPSDADYPMWYEEGDKKPRLKWLNEHIRTTLKKQK